MKCSLFPCSPTALCCLIISWPFLGDSDRQQGYQVFVYCFCDILVVVSVVDIVLLLGDIFFPYYILVVVVVVCYCSSPFFTTMFTSNSLVLSSNLSTIPWILRPLTKILWVFRFDRNQLQCVSVDMLTAESSFWYPVHPSMKGGLQM